jgi:probable DNA repair protein
LPDSESDSLYDIEPLAPLIETGYVLLTPNYRLARRVKTVWDARQAAAGKTLWAPVKVYALESWLSQRWDQAVELGLIEPKLVIDDGRAACVWQQVIAEHQNSSGAYSLLRPTAAAALASQARETLLRWQVDISAPDIRQAFKLDDDCATYLAWQVLFQKKLDEQGLISQADAYAQLLSVAPTLPKSPLALLGFDDMPPLYSACIESLSSQLERLDPGLPAGQCFAHAFADKRSELSAIARWARQLHDDNHEARVGIILPDMIKDRPVMEQLLRSEFRCQGENYHALPVNFSAGISADRVPLVRDALSILALCQPRVLVPDVIALLESRFVDLPDVHSALAVKFINGLFKDGREEVDIGELRFLASQVSLGDRRGLSLGQNLMAMSQMRALRSERLPSEWIGVICEVLDIWHWPGPGPLDSLEYQQVEMWQKFLEDFASYDCVMGAVPFTEALSLLGRCAGRQIFQPQTADSAIQVLGMLEGSGLQFDHLWICGLQGGTWPAPVRPSPLIPIALQRQLQMPHASAEREWAFAAGLMGRYVRSAREINGSYVQQVDGIPELPSALLADFQWLEVKEKEEGIDPRWYEQREAFALDTLLDDRAPVVSRDEAGHMGGGSGLLEDQSHCPFRAFAKRRLSVQALGEFQIGLSAAARGSILHDALFALWGAIADSATLREFDNASLEQKIVDAAAAALQSIPSRARQGFGQAYLELEGQRLQAVLQEWLFIEKQRSDFVVQARELDITLSMDPLVISLRVDRIDQLPNGSQLIIDYKSGRCKVGDWLGERPSKPQLLLYGLAAAADAEAPEVSAISFAQVRPRDCAYVGAGLEEVAPGIRSLNAVWRDILARLVQEFVDGEAAVDPLSESSCSYCGLESLCRIGDTREVAR